MGTSLKSPKEVAAEIMSQWDQETRLSTVRMERDIAAALEERDQRIRDLEHELQDMRGTSSMPLT